MSWQILLAISIATNSVSSLLQRVLLKDERSDATAYSIAFQLTTGVLMLMYAAWNGIRIPDLAPILPNLALMLFLYGVGNVLVFKALKVTEASEFTVIFASRAFWTIAVAILFLHEQVSFMRFVGALLVLAGIILVSIKEDWVDTSFHRGTLFALLAAAFFGIQLANDAYILKFMDAPLYLALALAIPAIPIWIARPAATEGIKKLFAGGLLKKFFSLAIVYDISAITLFLAYQAGNNIAQIAPINQFATILTVLLAIFLLKETNRIPQKVFGAFVSVVGVILVR